jgi:hypothetical protein
MTLATQNGSLIVKDGKLAENCGCCGDGWYCCPDQACIGYSISSATVTVSASDYLKQTTSSLLGCSNGPLREYASVGFLGSALAGTKSLSKQSNGTWRYDYQPQAGGSCQASLVLSFPIATTWQLVFTYSVVSFVVTNSTSPVASHKELADMTCGQDGFFIGPAGDCNAGFPLSRGPNGIVTINGGFGTKSPGALQGAIQSCSYASFVNTASQNNNWSTVQLNAGTPTVFQPAWPAFGSIVKESGVNSATISIAFA